MKKFLSLFFALVFALSISAQVYYLLPNSADANCENITNQYDHPTEGNRLQWETSEGNVPQCPERNAFDWFARSYCDASIPWIHNEGDHQIRRIVTFKDLTDGRLAAEGNMFNDVKVIWVNVDRNMTEAAFDAMFPTDVRTALANYVKAGGNLYLSTFAARLAYLIGRAPAPNGVAWNNGFASAGDEWKLTAHFKKGGDGSYDVDKHGHAIFKYLRDNNLYADDYHFHMQKGSPRTNRNCLWDIDDNITAFNNFQNDNSCGILGSWGHTAEFLCAGLVEFYPVGDWKGTIITNGLAACSFASTNDRSRVEHLTRGILDYLKARPCAVNNTTPMETKLAENGFYPDNPTTFLKLHPVCEGLSAAYALTSNPDGIARIQGGVIVGENTITQLQFKEAGKAVTLHITLTENREFMNWPKGTYEYDRAITFSYADADAAQKVVDADLSSNGIDVESSVQMAMRLHPNMRGMDSLSYTIDNHYAEGEAYKETKDGVTRLYFSKSGKVLLTVRLNEPNEWREEWPAGVKELTHEVEFHYTQKDGPVFPWPAEFTDDANPKSVITFPETVEGLAVTYSIEDGDNASLENNVLTLADVTAGQVTVHASVTENDFKVTWPKGTYNYSDTINFVKKRPKSDGENPVPMEVKLEEEFFYPSNTTTFRTLHPVCEGLSAAYSLTSNPNNIARIQDGQLQFKAAGTVNLHIVLTESRGDREWEDGDYEYDREIKFAYADAQAAQDGPNFTWPSQFETGAVGPNSVITLPETVAELPVTYEVTGNASLDGNEMTLANVESGSVTVNASVTETGYHEAWPAGVYNYQNSLTFHAAEVGYLLPAAESIDHLKFSDDLDYQGQQPEYNAAKWFEDNYITCANPKGRFVTVDELPTLKAKGIKALWVNIERVNIDNVNGLLTACLTDDGLKTYIQAGGNVLLTKQATRLAFTMGRIGYEPAFNAGGYVTDNFGAQRSVATRMGISADEILDMSGHRLFTDMLSWTDSKNVYLVGETCLKTNNYCSWQDFFTDNQGTHAYDNGNIQRLRDFETAWNATVFGIRGDIVDYCLSNIIEFNATGVWQGRILTIGSAAYQWGSANPTTELDNVKKLTANSLSYLLDEPLADEVYTRNGLTPGIYGTICFDYAVEAGHIEGAEIYELTSFNATNDGVILTQVDAMVAGRPYFFLPTANELRLTYNGQRVAAGSYHGLVGHIGETTLHITPNVNNYILYNNELLLVDTDDIELLSYRAYINKYNEIPAYSEPTSNAPRRIMAIEPPHNAPTAVEAVDMQAAQGVYDIMGRKLSAPQGNGFYIINGKKVIITQ